YKSVIPPLNKAFNPLFLGLCVCPPAAVQSLNILNDQIALFMVNGPKAMAEEDRAFLPSEMETLKTSMALMRRLIMDSQVK
uniref:Uncharacterized protein n=1 Tax=Oncorhynchus tshawytscha TaxID=74940 RepID=A0AAZ3QVM0_ONCTS